jgi:hypothetical protein
MFGQQSVYILGIFNLILAGIAIFCVALAEDQPEYFSLVYIAISIFIFYMGTIVIIIMLQIIETCQEQNQLSLDIQRPVLATEIASQTNSVTNDENIIIPTERKPRLSRSHTLPLTLSLYNSHHTPLSPLDVKDFKTTSTCLTLLPKCQQSLATIHKNYQSFAFITSDQRYPSS